MVTKVHIGSNFPKKMMNPALRSWKKGGYPLIWEKFYKDEETLVRPRKMTKAGRYRRTYVKKQKHRYYNVFTLTKY